MSRKSIEKAEKICYTIIGKLSKGVTVCLKYPDYSSKSQHITYISITDPEIEVYGLTINSTQEEIRYQMEEKSGYTIEELGGNTLVARKGDYTFSFSPNKITIRVNVTNKQGIIF